jgi:hypothetical protein
LMNMHTGVRTQLSLLTRSADRPIVGIPAAESLI